MPTSPSRLWAALMEFLRCFAGLRSSFTTAVSHWVSTAEPDLNPGLPSPNQTLYLLLCLLYLVSKDYSLNDLLLITCSCLNMMRPPDPAFRSATRFPVSSWDGKREKALPPLFNSVSLICSNSFVQADTDGKQRTTGWLFSSEQQNATLTFPIFKGPCNKAGAKIIWGNFHCYH